ncbi:hypothetical protein [Prescottella subtropica]|uniref:hypothetical protein n=1 Tax=Prescottella subtropica TaxID=2545757 RepID=UPI0010F6D1DC|nr:hypothetical protein [Prescottella subtropica]
MNMFKRGTLVAAVAALVPLGVVVANETASSESGAPTAPTAPSAILDDFSVSVPGVEELISGLTVVDVLPKVCGYERDYGKGKVRVAAATREESPKGLIPNRCRFCLA